MIGVRIDIEKKEYITIVKERKATNVSVVKDVFSKRKMQTGQPNIDIWDNTCIVIYIWEEPGKNDPIGVIGDTYNDFALFTQWARDSS